ncbi:MAG: hypothetical protein HY760_07055 [Nitrospirae bacterium]|nr:hypothetical protein [Nitrospirota bacterium]
MKKTHALWAVLAIMTVIAPILQPKEASAIPAFARQTGMACATCHFQHYPALNAFGRNFKMAGYTMIGPQGKVEGEGLSIPDTLNASLVTKIRYQKENGDTKEGKDQGELQFPDEGALLIGGRAGRNVGFLLELATFGAADTGSGAVTGESADTGSGDFSLFASFRMPMVWDLVGMKFNVVPFTTDSAGAAYGFELLNTGAQRMLRILEDDRKATSAQLYIGTEGEAEGVAFALANNLGFINATLWGPAHGTVDTGLRLSHYLRAAITPTLGEWDTAAGIQYWGGQTEVGNTDTTPDQIYHTNAWALDAQAQGAVGTMPLGVYLTYASAAKDDVGAETNFFNDNPNAKTAWTVLAELGVIPSKMTAGLGYRGGDTGATGNSSDNATVLGVTYLMAQNLELQANHTFFSGDVYPKANDMDQRTTLMLFAAF